MRSPRSDRRSRVENFSTFAPVIVDARAVRDRGALGQQAHDGARGHRLAGAGFADDGDGFAAMELEGNVLHRLHGAVLDLEGDGDVAGVDDRLAVACAAWSRRSAGTSMFVGVMIALLNTDRSHRAGRRRAH